MPGRHAPLAERLWRRVDRSGGLFACWPWTGHVNRPGPTRSGGVYGRIQVGGVGSRRVYVHRLALILATGEDPPDKEACHAVTCTTSLCCNDAHLRWGTRAENVADWTAKYGKTDQALVADAVARVLAEGEETDGGDDHDHAQR